MFICCPSTALFAFLLLLNLQTQQFWQWAAGRGCVVAIPLVEGFTAFIQRLDGILTTSLTVIVLDKAICGLSQLEGPRDSCARFLVLKQQPTLDCALEIQGKPLTSIYESSKRYVFHKLTARG